MVVVGTMTRIKVSFAVIHPTHTITNTNNPETHTKAPSYLDDLLAVLLDLGLHVGEDLDELPVLRVCVFLGSASTNIQGDGSAHGGGSA